MAIPQNRDANRDSAGRFLPGAVSNPGGRPKANPDFVAWCKDFMAVEGRDILATMARDSKSPYRARAIELISAYAYGKPLQQVEHTGEAGGPVVVTLVIGEVPLREQG